MAKRKADETTGKVWRDMGLPIKLPAKKHATTKAPLPFRSSAELSGDVLVVKVPLPHKILHPNGRTKNWLAKVGESRKSRSHSFVAILYDLINSFDEDSCWPRCRIDAKFIGVQRSSDEANLQGWIKPTIDGIADAISGGQDKGYKWGLMTCEPAKGQTKHVVITVTRLE